MNFKNYLNEAESTAKVKYKLIKNSAIGNILLGETDIAAKIVDDIRRESKGDGFDIDEGDIYFTHIEPLQNGNFKVHIVAVMSYDDGKAGLDKFEAVIDKNANVRSISGDQGDTMDAKKCRDLANSQGIRLLDI